MNFVLRLKSHSRDILLYIHANIPKSEPFPVPGFWIRDAQPVYGFPSSSIYLGNRGTSSSTSLFRWRHGKGSALLSCLVLHWASYLPCSYPLDIICSLIPISHFYPCVLKCLIVILSPVVIHVLPRSVTHTLFCVSTTFKVAFFNSRYHVETRATYLHVSTEA
jgi:hypothetical protein